MADGTFEASSSHDGTNLNLALALAQAGLPVFPCLEADGLAHDRDGKPKAAKAPYTGGGFKDATTDEARIKSWWARWPAAVPGLPTGEVTGLSVIDGDIDRDTGEATGEAQIADLNLDHPDAVHIRTQSGGVQIIYRHVEGARSTGKQVASKIDTRGAGGYIIAPGARMQNGATYRYEGRSLSVALLANDLPDYPVKAVEAEIAKVKQADQQARYRIDPGPSDYGQTEASDAETIEVIRRLLAEAPNHLCREDWVKLAVSLRVAYGESLRDAFTGFSLGYIGATPCTPQDAAHVWQSSGTAHTVSGIGPALALLKNAVGPDRFKTVWREVFAQRDEVNDRPFAPSDSKKSSGIILPKPERSSRFYSAAELKGKPVPPREWLVQDLVPQKTVTLFGGDGGTGKSLLALQLAVASVAGGGWLGRAVQSGRVIFISAEDDDDELHRRVDDILRAGGLSYDAIAGLTLRSLAGEDALLAVETQIALIQSALFDELDAQADQDNPVLIVIDTLADVYPSNENDRVKVRQFVGILRSLALKRQCAVMLLAHPSLTGLNSGSGTSGSTAWNNSVRSRLYMSRVAQDGYEPDPDARMLATKKANYGRIGGEIAMRWQCGVFVAEAEPTGLDRMAMGAKAERVFLTLLRTFAEQGRKVNHAGGPTYAPKIFATHPGAEGMTKPALKTAMENLLSRGSISIAEDGPPSKRRQFLEASA